jgi:CRP-like cAMP-binding protein
MVRAYSERADTQVTFWFGKEGDTVISMKSFVANEKGYESIELIEDSELYKMDVDVLNNLYNQDIHIANWGRKFAEQELLKVEERLISRQFRTALERYNEILTSYPHLIKRVQLGHIASYLGITQASLSRIRAELK